MKYEIKLNNDSLESREFPSAKTYSESITKQKLYRDCLIATIILILLNSVYPSFITDAMEKIGLIKYVEFTNVHIEHRKYFRDIESMTGEYVDDNNNIHRVNIHSLWGFDTDSIKEGGRLDGAYYTFLPSYEFVRSPSIISLIISYSAFIFFLPAMLRQKFIRNKFMTSFSRGQLIRPISFSYKEAKLSLRKINTRIEEKILGYDIYVLWQTPAGNYYENQSLLRSPTIINAMTFDSEYCGIYLEQNNGDFMIIRPQNVAKVVKLYNLKIDPKTRNIEIKNKNN